MNEFNREIARKNIVKTYEIKERRGIAKEMFCYEHLLTSNTKQLNAWLRNEVMPQKGTIQTFSLHTGIPIDALCNKILTEDEIIQYLAIHLKNKNSAPVKKDKTVFPKYSKDSVKNIIDKGPVYMDQIMTSYKAIPNDVQFFLYGYYNEHLHNEGIIVKRQTKLIDKNYVPLFEELCDLMPLPTFRLAYKMVTRIKKLYENTLEKEK